MIGISNLYNIFACEKQCFLSYQKKELGTCLIRTLIFFDI